MKMARIPSASPAIAVVAIFRPTVVRGQTDIPDPRSGAKEHIRVT
jgi:hypothetical protein